MWFALVAASALAADAGLWEAALALDGERTAAVARCDEVRAALQSVAGGFDVDPASVDLMRRVRDASIELDLGRLYAMLPTHDGDARTLHARSDARESAYGYTLFPSAAQREADVGLLEFETSLAMRPVEHAFGAGQGYGIRHAVRAGTGGLEHRRLAAVLERFLVLLQQEATAPHDESRLVAARRQQPGLAEPADLAIVGAFIAAAPELTSTLAPIVDVHRVGGVHDGLLDLSLDARIDTDALGRGGYPSLEKYLERMGDVLRVDVSVRDARGLSLADLAVRTSRPGVAVRAVSRDGALVPRDGSGPRPEHAIHPTDASIDLKVVVDVELRLDGLLMRVLGLRFPIRYRSEDAHAAVAIDMNDPPRIELTGTNTVSAWFAELADSALNLEAQGEVVFRAMSEGTDGRGTRARATFAGGELAGGVDLVLVDNALVRFATGLAGRYLAPPDAVVGEGVRLLSDALRALDRDYAAVRPTLLHPTPRP